MSDEESVRCPYCNSDADCQHLLAYYDETFDELSGGYIVNKDDHDDIIKNFFNSYVNEHGFTKNLVGIRDLDLKDIWSDLVAQKEYADFDEGSKSYDVSGIVNSTYKFAMSVLDDICIPEYFDFEGGPGQSSLYKVYYSKDPDDTYQQLLVKIKSKLDSYLSSSLQESKKSKKRN